MITKNNPYEGCLMMRLEVEDWIKLRDIIDEDDLSDSGIDSSPHITLVFGLDSLSNTKEIKEVLKSCDMIGTEIELSKTNVFKNENDVLHYTIIEPSLYSKLKLSHLKISSSIDSKLTHKDYKPHVTIAYLKSGTSDKYIAKIPKLLGKVTNYWYSTTFKI